MNKILISLVIILIICISGYLVINNFNSESDNKAKISDKEMMIELETKKDQYEEFLSENPGNIEALQETIYLKYTLEEYEEAVELCLKLIELDPENYMNYYLMANIKTRTKEWDSAIKYREKSFELEKTSHMLYYLSTNYIVSDANHALELMADLDSYEMGTEGEFLKKYKNTLKNYLKDPNYENIKSLMEFIPETILKDEIIKNRIAAEVTPNEITKLKELRNEINNVNF